MYNLCRVASNGLRLLIHKTIHQCPKIITSNSKSTLARILLAYGSFRISTFGALVPNSNVLSDKTVVGKLDCTEAFNALSTTEKMYAHHLSEAVPLLNPKHIGIVLDRNNIVADYITTFIKAIWIGSLIILVQTSPESPLIFSLLHRVFLEESLEELRCSALEAGVSESEFKAFLVYACGFFDNYGNYLGIGDRKFIPNLPAESFMKIIHSSKAYHKHHKQMCRLWCRCNGQMYSLHDENSHLGLKGKGVTKYFSANCTEQDAELVNEWMQSQQVEAWNSRCFKTETPEGKTLYTIKMAGVKTRECLCVTKDEEEYKECMFKVSRGDYTELMDAVNEKLEAALKYTSNETETKMLEHYIDSFDNGNISMHKDGTRVWLQNKDPVIETYIGFIETYRDPSGQRAEFEGFVAMVNKNFVKKLKCLVDRAEYLLKSLPWPASFEKDEFMIPNFAFLEVLTFGSSVLPVGINIPNYDEIRQNDGIKNVYLSNVVTALLAHSAIGKVPFVSEEDAELIKKLEEKSIEIHSVLHELLGHGSGKLFTRSEDGTMNFDSKRVTNPLNGCPIDSWFNPGETFDNKFGPLGSAMEESRADAVGLYLCTDKDVGDIFCLSHKEQCDVAYVNWLSMAVNGIKALEAYDPEHDKFMQPHMHARFVILNMLLQTAPDLFIIRECNNELLITLDRSKIGTLGRQALCDFLLRMQVYKSTGDTTSAMELFKKYSEVSSLGRHPWARWRDIAMEERSPPIILVQSNTCIKEEKENTTENEVYLKCYSSDFAGVIKSWTDRYPDNKVDELLEKVWLDDLKYFPRNL